MLYVELTSFPVTVAAAAVLASAVVFSLSEAAAM